MKYKLLFLIISLFSTYLSTDVSAQRLGANLTGLTIFFQGGEIYRVQGTYNDPTGVTNGNNVIIGDFFWTPPLNPGDTCRVMLITNIVSSFSGFITFDVDANSQGSPSTQNSKIIRHTSTNHLPFIPSGGNEALLDCISQYLSSKVDDISGSIDQTLSRVGSDLTISGAGGNTVTLPSASSNQETYYYSTNVDSLFKFSETIDGIEHTYFNQSANILILRDSNDIRIDKYITYTLPPNETVSIRHNTANSPATWDLISETKKTYEVREYSTDATNILFDKPRVYGSAYEAITNTSISINPNNASDFVQILYHRTHTPPLFQPAGIIYSGIYWPDRTNKISITVDDWDTINIKFN